MPRPRVSPGAETVRRTVRLPAPLSDRIQAHADADHRGDWSAALRDLVAVGLNVRNIERTPEREELPGKQRLPLDP